MYGPSAGRQDNVDAILGPLTRFCYQPITGLGVQSFCKEFQSMCQAANIGLDSVKSRWRMFPTRGEDSSNFPSDL